MASLRAPAHFPATVPADMKCSICLENVVDDSLKGITKLQCGHFFHLACIGPEFNVKGAMVCPNCREVEDSEWKYSLGSFTNYLPQESSDEEAVPVQSQNLHAPHPGSFDARMASSAQRSAGSPLSRYNRETTQMSLFDYGGSNNNGPFPYVHPGQHTYVGPILTGNTIGYETNPHSVSTNVNSLDHCSQFRNWTGLGLGGSAGAGTSAGGPHSTPRNRFANLQLPAFPGVNNYGELDLLYRPEAPAYYGSGSSASADLPELTLNVGGGSPYGSDQPNHLEGADDCPLITTVPVYGSAAFPIEIDLDSPEGANP